MGPRKICVVTGTRAEYGLLYWLMKEIQQDADLELQLIVTGAHLSPVYGYTVQEIEQDGFFIHERIEMLLASDTPAAVTKAMGLALIGFAEAYARLKPDIVVVLGDRYEIMTAAQAAMVARIPIAHIHGGERTEGAIDDAIRHSITKMSHLHFVSTEDYRRRVIQLGEHPERVYNFGAIGIDNIMKLSFLERDELERLLDFSLGEKYFVVTYHPVTLDASGPSQAFRNLLDAIREFPEYQVIMTKPNADPYSHVIIRMMEHFAAEHRDRILIADSLGQLKYLSAVKHCDMVIGNSSSGIIEVPLFKKPTINIGDRQKGRAMGPTIINVPESKEAIIEAIRYARSESFISILEHSRSIYGMGDVSGKIKQVLKEASLEGILYKSFYDLLYA
jgi:UDP-N-acetylglucosamine 2-epimerase (non-hydrolysing)/GDP/UDP-N,N'-diacetylbacillosamine 2-epimerase (hydrolysing)